MSTGADDSDPGRLTRLQREVLGRRGCVEWTPGQRRSLRRAGLVDGEDRLTERGKAVRKRLLRRHVGLPETGHACGDPWGQISLPVDCPDCLARIQALDSEARARWDALSDGAHLLARYTRWPALGGGPCTGDPLVLLRLAMDVVLGSDRG